MSAETLTAAIQEMGIAASVFVTGGRVAAPWGVSVGMSDIDEGCPLSVDTPFRIASNTKTFVAATVLRLWEQRKLALDAPIGSFLTPTLDGLLRSAGYSTKAITVRHLLDHSGGLYDHGDDPRYIETVLSDPAHRWTREEQIRLAVEYSPPLNTPGVEFSYSDTGYILLGDIIERITDRPLARAVRRELSFERLGLLSTWWELAEPQPREAGARARQYLGEIDVTDVNATMDIFGGGGLVTSVRDLAVLFAGVFEGRVYDRQTTLVEMLSKGTHRYAETYRLGVFASRINGSEVYSHLGFWGSAAYYSPSNEIAIAAFTTNREHRAALVDTIEHYLGQLLASS